MEVSSYLAGSVRSWRSAPSWEIRSWQPNVEECTVVAGKELLLFMELCFKVCCMANESGCSIWITVSSIILFINLVLCDILTATC